MSLRLDLQAIGQSTASPAGRALHAALQDFCETMSSDFAAQQQRHRQQRKPGLPNFKWNNRGEITSTFFRLMDAFKKWYSELSQKQKATYDFHAAFTILGELALKTAEVPADSFGVKKFDTKIKDWEHGGTRYSANGVHQVKNVLVTQDYSLVVDETVVDPAEAKKAAAARAKEAGDKVPLTREEQAELDRRNLLERQRRTDLRDLREKERQRKQKQISLEEMEQQLRGMVGDQEGGLLVPARDTEAFLDMFEQEKADESFKLSLLTCLFESTEPVRQRFEERRLVPRLRFWAKRHQHSSAPAELKVLQAVLKVVAVVPMSHQSAASFNAGNLLQEIIEKHPDKFARAYAAEAFDHVRALRRRHLAARRAERGVEAVSDSGSTDSDSDSGSASDSDSSSSSDSESESDAEQKQAAPKVVAAAKPKPKPKTAPAVPPRPSPGPTASPPGRPAWTPTVGQKLFDLGEEAAQRAAAAKAAALEPPAKRQKRVTFKAQPEEHVLPPSDAADPSEGAEEPPRVGLWGQRGPTVPRRELRTLALPPEPAERPRWPRRVSPPAQHPRPSSPPPSYAAATAATAAPAGSPPDPGRPAEGPATAPATEGPGPATINAGAAPSARPLPSVADIISLAQALSRRQRLAEAKEEVTPQVLPERDPRREAPPQTDTDMDADLTPASQPSEPAPAAARLSALWTELRLERRSPDDSAGAQYVQAALRQARGLEGPSAPSAGAVPAAG